MRDRPLLWCGLALLLASGCTDSEAVGGGESGELPAHAPACVVSGATAEIQANGIYSVDLLFVVDNSSSMQEEQAALVAQFPRLLRLLTSGDRNDDGQPDFPPVEDLHLGVVSSDMGAANASSIEACEGLGDDGLLQHEPTGQGAGCQASYPPFLAYTKGTVELAQSANDLACIAALGTEGCGIEQPLEAALKALWPAIDPMAMNGVNRIQFLGGSSGAATQGHGDGENAGFLRNDPAQGQSVLAIVVVTDDEDCSSNDTRQFTPAQPPPNDPMAIEDPNLRCWRNPGKLYPLERYIKGFQALQPEAPNLVVFSAIAGVPPDLVEREDYDRVDWFDDAQRDSFYDRILADPRMQEQVDPSAPTNLLPSCNTARGRAYPPRRLVQVARGYKANGSVHSLCQEDLSAATEKIVESIGRQLGAPCLPQPLPRNAEGLVGCDVVWELPPRGEAQPSTPTVCGAPGFEFLRPIGPGRPEMSDRGGALCRVPQLPVRRTDGVARPLPVEVDDATFADGWYYDDFSESVARECSVPAGRVSFTDNARPPAGISVRLECLSERHVVPGGRPGQATTREQPRIGDACDIVHRNGSVLEGDDACAVRLERPSSAWPDGVDRSMFCHPDLKSCVLSCAKDSDCPDDWSCDDSQRAIASAGKSLCTPPECSVGAASADARRVGDPCLPEIVPEYGFDEHETYLATGSTDCGGGVCLVFRLHGDPRAGCVPLAPNPTDPSNSGRVCAAAAELERRVYCSCRCNAPEGGEECDCPSGFSCLQALEQGGPQLAGGYCVRDGTFF